MINNGSTPASPVECSWYVDETRWAMGLTKREAFAMAAMQGLCVALHDEGVRLLLVREADKRGVEPKDRLAAAAVEYADALLAALDQEGPQ
jgi:hypothetical protein